MSTLSLKKEKPKLDMLSGPLVPSFIKFALPLILSTLLQILYNAADVAAVGNLASTDDVAAVGATTILVNIFVVFVANVPVGSNIIAARAYGANDDEKLKRIVSTSYTVSIMLGIVFMIFGEFLTKPLLNLTNCPPEIIDKSALYMQIFFCGLPGSSFYNFLAAILRSSGDTKRSFKYLAISGAVNVILNVILILTIGDAVASVAISTVVSQYLSAVLILVHFVRRKDASRLYPLNLTIEKDTFLKIIKLGVPATISSLCYSFANIIIQSEINSFGSTEISGNTAATTVESFVFAITGAASATTAVFIGQNLGAGNRDRIPQILKKGYVFWCSVAAVMCVFCLLCGRFILGLIIPGEFEAISYGMIRVYFICGSAIVHAAFNINNGAMQAFGYSAYQMIVNVLCICGFRIPWMLWIYPLNQNPDLNPIMLYVLYPISFVLVLIVNSIFVSHIMKRLKKGEKFSL
jgi:putative MATE family efflux protein